MIVDVHTHIFAPDHFDEGFLDDLRIARPGVEVKIAVTFDEYMQAMAPVDRACCFGLRGLKTGLHTPNDYVAEFVARAPEKLIGFMSIDPNEPGYLDVFEHSLHDLKLRGLKLGPIYAAFDPSDPRMDHLYAQCIAHNLPVLFHVGTSFVRFGPLKWTRPYLWDELACRYPDLKMILAHLGHPWEGECIAVVRKHPNVFADLSAIYYRPWQFYNSMMLAQEYGIQHKILFGTDYPFTTAASSFAGLRNVNQFCEGTNLPRVNPDAIEAIIHRDAIKLLWG